MDCAVWVDGFASWVLVEVLVDILGMVVSVVYYNTVEVVYVWEVDR